MNVKLPFDPIERARELWRHRWGDTAPYDAMATATSIMRVQQRLLADLDAAVAPHGLTFARYEALVLLAFSRQGRLPMSKVGERLMIHPTSATNIVQRLASDGLVERAPNPRDGRGTLACITPVGEQRMEQATAALHAIDFGLAATSDRDRRQLWRLLRTMRQQAGDFAK